MDIPGTQIISTLLLYAAIETRCATHQRHDHEHTSDTTRDSAAEMPQWSRENNNKMSTQTSVQRESHDVLAWHAQADK